LLAGIVFGLFKSLPSKSFEYQFASSLLCGFPPFSSEQTAKKTTERWKFKVQK